MARTEEATHSRARRSYAKRMSDNVAAGLVVYTLALIFITSPAMHSEGTSILPYFMLVVFVAMVVPACHGLERRWAVFEKGELSEATLHTRFGVDCAKIWIGAIAIPIALAALFTIF